MDMENWIWAARAELVEAWTANKVPFDKRSTELTPKAQGERVRKVQGEYVQSIMDPQNILPFLCFSPPVERIFSGLKKREDKQPG